MSATAHAIIDRTVTAYKAHGENGGTYLLVALATLAGSAPEVAAFILDHADSVAATWTPPPTRPPEPFAPLLPGGS